MDLIDEAPHAMGPDPSVTVPRAVQLHRWADLSFLHWPYPPETVRPLVPPELEVDTFDGRAWIGLIPFRLFIRRPCLPYVPWAGRFVETNVRTYVRAPDGTRGIWFLSLDAARFGAALFGRAIWALPNMWSRMRLHRAGDLITYACRRRFPSAVAGTSRITLRIGTAYDPSELAELDHFLTARWALFSAHQGELARTNAVHRAWPLVRAEVVELDDGLVAATGLPAPRGTPLVHHADAVDVRLGPRTATTPSPDES
jgi:uncharacterized protein YqjF (DUF2071 family)